MFKVISVFIQWFYGVTLFSANNSKLQQTAANNSKQQQTTANQSKPKQTTANYTANDSKLQQTTANNSKPKKYQLFQLKISNVCVSKMIPINLSTKVTNLDFKLTLIASMCISHGTPLLDFLFLLHLSVQ